jgi:hypothetical protein
MEFESRLSEIDAMEISEQISALGLLITELENLLNQ